MANSVNNEIKGLVAEGRHEDALNLLRNTVDFAADFRTQNGYARALKAIDGAKAGLKTLRLALVPFYCTVDHFAEVLRLWAAIQGFELELYISEFDTVEQSLLDPNSELYAFNPDVVWLFNTWRDILPRGIFPESSEMSLAQAAFDRFQGLWDAVATNSSAYILQNNADLPPVRVFGNHAQRIPWSRSRILRRFNQLLAENNRAGLEVFDLEYLSGLWGKLNWADERYWYYSKHPFSLEALGLVSFNGARVLCGLKGLSAKCLVLDLDNTMWGGVIGDDGMEGIRLGFGADGEAYQDLQRYVLALKKRGIILTVCSKNEAEIAKQPFTEHPDMVLCLDDIAVFVANWHNKADNIRYIAKTLNIGLDSMVFLDDNPVERALVQRELPMVTVPELPDDPALYVRTLDEGRYFELASYTDEDATRSDMYRQNACRAQLKESSTDTEAFLEGLNMASKARDLDSFSLPRISQLINKANQFHVTTTRYTESELRQLIEDGLILRSYTLTDRFGDNGLIAGIILKKVNGSLEFDTWVMSCRVLCRGMEQFIHNDVLAIAKDLGVTSLVGRYRPTPKNKMVAELYSTLGYTLLQESEEEKVFRLDICDADLLSNHIHSE